MKEVYINYLGRMKEIEDNISSEDKDVLNDYLNFCSLSSGEDKVLQRKRYVLQFIDIAETKLKEFNNEVIEHIYKLIKNTDREIAGKNEVIKQLKFFIRWKFEDENLIKFLKAIPQRRGYNTRKLNPQSLIKEEEIKKLITSCKSNPKHLAMISLQTELGLRPHEVLALTWNDINTDIGEIKVFTNKTKETRIIPFQTSIQPILNWKEVYHYPDIKNNDLIFPHPYIRKKKLYRSYLSQLYRRICKKVGLRHLYPYLARHTKMTEANKKMPSKVASAYGGHSEKTAGRYTHLSEADIRDVVLKEMYNIKEPTIAEKTTIKKLKKEITKIENMYVELALKVDEYFEKKGVKI